VVLELVSSPWLLPALLALVVGDAFLVVLPSETLVVALGAAWAATGSPALAPVVLVAAIGAIIGENHDGAFVGERLRSVHALDRALRDLSEVPPAMCPRIGAQEAIDALLSTLARESLRDDCVRDGVSLLRWLDAGIADEKHLVLAGLVDGLVPETPSAARSAGDSRRQRKSPALAGSPSTNSCEVISPKLGWRSLTWMCGVRPT